MKNNVLSRLNEAYLKVHVPKEEAFWAEKMALKTSKPGEFVRAEAEFQGFITDSSWIPEIDKALGENSISVDERVGLQGWKRLFEVNAVGNAEALSIKNELLEIESTLQGAVRTKEWSYFDTKTNQRVPASLNRLGLMIGTESEESNRKGALEALRDVEIFALDNGFLEMVTLRNRLARLLGFENFYAYRVQMNEGFGVGQLFKILDDFESKSKESGKRAVDKVVAKYGSTALQPWNLRYFVSGDLEKQLDPYFSFGSAARRWAESFARMGIDYRGAKLSVDLVNRNGKYHNGFMHAPFPSFVDDKAFRSARINFTANAVPGQVGSGKRALETLFHEGGHAAHFSNVEMPAVSYSQEYPPTSMAFAETQSMFLDSLVTDPQWLVRYAKSEEGKEIPIELVEALVKKNREFAAWSVRSLMVVPYGERLIYEMPDADRTASRIIETLRGSEERLAFTKGHARPTLSVPHLLSGESAASYHGYVLAMFGVEQTREHFMKRDGHIVDNATVGPELAAQYWKPGNSKTLFEFVRGLTGQEFSATAMLQHVNAPIEEILSEVRHLCDRIRSLPKLTGPVTLDAEITFVHGDETIASYQPGQDFSQCATRFENWIKAHRDDA